VVASRRVAQQRTTATELDIIGMGADGQHAHADISLLAHELAPHSGCRIGACCSL
jgi:hypothetical protein